MTILKNILIVLLLAVCTTAFCQKEEINAFEKQNKDLLKQLKKDFQAKPEVNMTKDGYFYIVLTKKIIQCRGLCCVMKVVLRFMMGLLISINLSLEDISLLVSKKRHQTSFNMVSSI